MYCPGCGAWNPDESEFCGSCGRPLPKTSETRPQKRAGSCLLVAVASVVLLIAIVAIGAFLMRDRLVDTWHSVFGQPTRIAVIPTAAPTAVPTQPPPTPLLTPSPSPSPTVTNPPTMTPTHAPTGTPTPRQRTFRLVYEKCIPHALSLGCVKGQVFDKNGKVIPGAKVRITIDDYEWESDANPATTNSEGWYEWVLETGQRIEFVELIVDGHSVSFLPEDFEVKATGGCFQRVDFAEE
jgi:hypothetical protein